LFQTLEFHSAHFSEIHRLGLDLLPQLNNLQSGMQIASAFKELRGRLLILE